LFSKADDFFRREAEDSTRSSPDWDYSKEISNLKLALSEIASRGRKIADVKAQAAKQTQQAMQFLQQQQQQLNAIQQQIAGGSSPWNIGAAYRVPDTNINLSCTYQQGRGNIQISCVPDESASLLGPNGKRYMHLTLPCTMCCIDSVYMLRIYSRGYTW
jgi:hypothetical protein